MRTKQVLGLAVVGLFACTASAAWYGEGEKQLKAGLQPGDAPSAFQTRDITGPNKGKSLCYV
jgi:hypothetical protein